MATKSDINYMDAFPPTMEALARGEVLLVSTDGQGHSSGLVIGWGSIGIIWGRTIFTAYVRPSRHTYSLLEASDDFTVNVMPPEARQAVSFWGKASGRDHDKWAKTGLRPAPSRQVRSPIVEQGILHFECRKVHHHDLVPANLAPEIGPAYYASGDHHKVYYGQILACYGV